MKGRPGWSTPRRLRVYVALVWIASAIVFAVGLRALNSDRATLRAIVSVTAPRIVAADELNAQLADLDTELANSVLGSAADRDVANELFELRRSAASRRLVDACGGVAAGQGERVLLVVLTEELGRYLELAVRTQSLFDAGDREGALATLRLATSQMHTRILPAASALDESTRREMDAQYWRAFGAAGRYDAEALVSGAILVVVLLAAQIFIRRRMRRRFSLPLLAATAIAVVFTGYLVVRFGGARRNLMEAHDSAFDSIHAMWRARALAYDAAGDESRWLLDRARAADYEGAFRGKTSQLLSRPGAWRVHSPQLKDGKVTGLLVDEANNVTFAGEEGAANDTLSFFNDYLAVDDRVRTLEKQGRHADALDLTLGARDEGARATFDRFDAAVQRTIAINQAAFDGIAATSDRSLKRAEWLDPAFAIVIALLAWLGVRPRLREYA